MKSQIFAGIALLIAGVYTVELNDNKQPEVQLKEIKVMTTQELIEKSSLNRVTEKIEQRQDSVRTMIREEIKDRIVDSAIMPKDSVIK